MTKMRVLLADDHTLVRQGLRALLQAEPDIEVVGEADTGRQTVELVRGLEPDLVVLDIAMPLLNGLLATRQISRHCPRTRVLVLSAYGDTEYVHQLVEAGAAGYLLKHSAAEELARAIREIARGNAYFCPAVAWQLRQQLAEPPGRARVLGLALTARETEVLQLIAEGLANKQIAAELSISIKTVEKHRQHVMNKLNIHETAGLTRYAIARGIIQPQLRTPVL